MAAAAKVDSLTPDGFHARSKIREVSILDVKCRSLLPARRVRTTRGRHRRELG